jgi:hypothetical protein
MARRLRILSATAAVLGIGAGLYLFVKSVRARTLTQQPTQQQIQPQPQQQQQLQQQLQLKVEVVCENNYKLCDSHGSILCVLPRGQHIQQGPGILLVPTNSGTAMSLGRHLLPIRDDRVSPRILLQLRPGQRTCDRPQNPDMLLCTKAVKP